LEEEAIEGDEVQPRQSGGQPLVILRQPPRKRDAQAKSRSMDCSQKTNSA
jgi:hypothetical protein